MGNGKNLMLPIGNVIRRHGMILMATPQCNKEDVRCITRDNITADPAVSLIHQHKV